MTMTFNPFPIGKAHQNSQYMAVLAWNWREVVSGWSNSNLTCDEDRGHCLVDGEKSDLFDWDF